MRICSKAASAFAEFLQARTTCQSEWPAICFAVAKPMPALAPVMTTVFMCQALRHVACIAAGDAGEMTEYHQSFDTQTGPALMEGPEFEAGVPDRPTQTLPRRRTRRRRSFDLPFYTLSAGICLGMQSHHGDRSHSISVESSRHISLIKRQLDCLPGVEAIACLPPKSGEGRLTSRSTCRRPTADP